MTEDIVCDLYFAVEIGGIHKRAFTWMISINTVQYLVDILSIYFDKRVADQFFESGVSKADSTKSIDLKQSLAHTRKRAIKPVLHFLHGTYNRTNLLDCGTENYKTEKQQAQ